MWWSRKKRPRAEKVYHMKVVEDFESRPHKAVSFVVERERRYRNGISKSCQRCCLGTVEEGCQEEVLKKQVKKKERKKTRTAEKEESGMKSFKKWYMNENPMETK